MFFFYVFDLAYPSSFPTDEAGRQESCLVALIAVDWLCLEKCASVIDYYYIIIINYVSFSFRFRFRFGFFSFYFLIDETTVR